MCGITGMFDTVGTRSISAATLSRMNDTQRHRGPDAGATYLAPGIGLGHGRLSVIDLATGQQPLFNEDGSVVVVSNGTIYNYQSLIPELQALGHVFHSRSDTEVIVHAWESWGPQCVQHFRGMFAFALWDRSQQTFFLARDRLGGKPLYYALLDDALLLFGSELKSLLAHGALARSVDAAALEDYLALGYVPEPRTIFRGACKLPPGHSLTLRRGYAVPQPQSYWDLQFTLDSRLKLQDAQAELLVRLEESVRLHMQADVPLGALLSGDVGSSAVVALLAGLSSTPLTTCSVGFAAAACDESGAAQQVASHCHTHHHMERIDSAGVDLIDTLAELYDEPFADSSAIATYRVCQMARQHVTVALSGAGAGVAFAGYPRYRLHLREKGVRRHVPLWLRQPLFWLLWRMLPRVTLHARGSDAVETYLHSMSVLQAPLRGALYSAGLRSELSGYSALEVFRRYAASAGTRDPLALLQWLATLPSGFKLQGRQGAWLLKQAMQPCLPPALLYRHNRGCAVPMAAWLRGPLQQRLRSAVLGPRLLDSGWFECRTLHYLVESHLSGARDHSAALWSLLMLEAFLRRVVDAPAVSLLPAREAAA